MRDRDEVLDGARAALNADPTVSMADLAAAIGIGRATLHRHFATREALLHEIGERSLDRWDRHQQDCDLASVTAGGDPEVIGACLDTMLRGLVAVTEDFDFALTDPAMNALPDLSRRSKELQAREVAFFAAAQEAGVLRGDLPPVWLSQTVYGLMITARETLRSGDVAPRSLPDLLVTTFLQGARPR